MQTYQNAWKAIVTSPEFNYEESYEFEDEFEIKGQKIIKEDLEIKTSEKNHGNKLEGKYLLDLLLPDIGVVLFDFRGCGNNKSEFVTLGLRESEDLDKLINELTQKYNINQFYFWGRSMGAVSIIHYIHSLETQILLEKQKNRKKNKKIEEQKSKFEKKMEKKFFQQEKSKIKKAKKNQVLKFEQNLNELERLTSLKKKFRLLILDSPFCDSYKLIKGIMVNQQNFSSLTSRIVLVPVRRSISSYLNYDVLGLNKPEEKMEIIKVPAVFMIGDNDDLIDQEGFKEMFNNYGGFLIS